MATKNVTLRLDEELLKDAQHDAVDEGLSLSAWLAKKIAEWSGKNAHYEKAKKTALHYLDTGLHLGGVPFSREELHER